MDIWWFFLVTLHRHALNRRSNKHLPNAFSRSTITSFGSVRQPRLPVSTQLCFERLRAVVVGSHLFVRPNFGRGRLRFGRACPANSAQRSQRRRNRFDVIVTVHCQRPLQGRAPPQPDWTSAAAAAATDDGYNLDPDDTAFVSHDHRFLKLQKLTLAISEMNFYNVQCLHSSFSIDYVFVIFW